ncbi:M10 family metallopeptidase C-terminal domain-containing protein [Phenylobacterium sp.]|uniref:M10 family metallopeptidase C-terminal domain-containing protein n=1 Tax=Phenylobacterium sp. TaxID=1871053 RepID=UPI002E35E61E|nr:M10 family metallopeptidase C-terminal domain-containing protein [Phenylobacterium sp.]HEX2560878.1 M10 family metallopeptidase C-terminal domain-containing protein [Phenylobacterium sp.]
MGERVLGSSAPLDVGADPFAPGEALPFLLEDYAGIATWAGKPIYNHEQVIGQLDSGRIIAGKTITFTFLETPKPVGIYNNPTYGLTEPGGYSPFSAAQREVAREAMQLWDDLIPQSIREKNGVGADIVFANTTTGPAQAHAYYPGKGVKVQSDIWTASPEANWTNLWLDFNGYGRTTLVHEAGHALGLTHPGDYDFGDDTDGDGEPDPITYEADAFYAQDTMQFTIMSYFSPQKTGAQPVHTELGLVGYAQTPLLHDILAIQSKYGADPTTRAGATTYGFNSNAGNEVYNFDLNRSPYLSIYDAGGVDTLDLSGADAGVFLDLRPGAFSSAGVRPTLAEANAVTAAFNAITDEDQGDFELWTQTDWDAFLTTIGNIGHNRVLADTGVAGVFALSHRNISIAYNTVIENATGGSARDYLVGNHVGNVLRGMGGDDVLNGLGGNDTLYGGTGADEFRFTETGGNDLIADYAAGEVVNVSEIDANPLAAGDQAFSAAQITRTFNAGANQTSYAFDVNGDASADMVIRLAGNVTLTTGVGGTLVL